MKNETTAQCDCAKEYKCNNQNKRIMEYKNRKSQEELDAMKRGLELKKAEYDNSREIWYKKMKSGEDTNVEWKEMKRLEGEYKELEYWFAIESAEQLYLNFYSGTDCYPYEVIERHDKYCIVRRMEWRPAPGAQAYSNDWVIFSCEGNALERVNLTKRGWHFPHTSKYAHFQLEPYYYFDYTF